VRDLFRYQAEERGVELSVYIAPGVPERLMTDSGRLRQALMNLVNNAAKFADPGPASIRVTLSTLHDEPVVRFAVRDCGPEIPDLDRARLFRPFSQLERQGSGGTGLGLAICQLLANLLGGQIGCDRTVDRGKEFWLTLPADVMDVPADWAPKVVSKMVPDWLPRTRVLLVEDVPANQMIVATVLRREGHMVDVASSGLEALEKVATTAYDIVFLDIFMPGIDGLETARRMRAMPGQRAGLPIVALTANVSGLDRADYIAAGMNDLVPKPVEKATLLGAIARHVWAGRRVGPSVPLRVVEPQALPAPRPADALDPARVAAWRTGLPAPICDALFADCIRQLRDMVPDLRTALTHRDRPSLKRVTHAMMGVAGNYGLAALESAVRVLGTQSPETLNADGEASAIDSEIDRADEAVRTLPQAQAA
jgi:CheY-like chemotaxis protein